MRSVSPKKRPPPIELPGGLRRAHSQNAFAIAKAREEEALDKHRERSNAFYALEKKSANSTPVGTPTATIINGGQQDLYLLKPSVNIPLESESTPMTTMTQFINYGDSNPSRSSDGDGLMSREPAVADRKSGQSQPSRQSSASDGDSSTVATARAMIEARHEKKLFKMMGVGPTSPAFPDTGKDDLNSTISAVPRIDLSDACVKAAEVNEKKQGEPKSPKKKIFGMSFPNFRSALVLPDDNPPMPPKAAQLLGSSASKKRRNPRPAKGQHSDASVSLPPNIRNPNRFDNNPLRSSYQPKPYYGPRTKFSSHPSSSRTPRWNNHAASKRVNSASDFAQLADREHSYKELKELPAIPTVDATTPNAKPKSTDKPKSGLGLTTTTSAEDDEQRSASAAARESRGSPAKFCPAGIQEYVSLVNKAPSVYSSHGVIENAGNLSAPLEGGSRPQADATMGRWSEGQAEECQRKSTAWLPPTFYSPSNYSMAFGSPGCRPSHNFDTQRYLFASPPNPQAPFAYEHASQLSAESIPVYFQGGSQEITPEAENSSFPAGSREVNNTPNRATSSSPGKNERTLASIVFANMRNSPEQSLHQTVDRKAYNHEPQSYRLTPILDDRPSPSKESSRGEFYPQYPSAMPTPLYGHNGHDISPPMLQNAHVLADGSDIITHFGVANHHIDLVADSLQKSIDRLKGETAISIETKHNETVNILEDHVADIKNHLNSVEHNMGRVSGETDTANSKLDKLMDFLRDAVVEPLVKNMQQNAELAKDVKSLQKTVQALQKKLETAPNLTQNAPMPSSSNDGALPMHHSNPLQGPYFDSPSQELLQELPIRSNMARDLRNDARFQRFYNEMGQSWSNPNIQRDHPDENVRRPYLAQCSGNPHGQFGGGYSTGYVGAYSTNGPDQGYAYGMNSK
ncbi:hypothetical protein K432DRAFT_447270 [Lepidopterella palustris CBS 459.81]|uniref:Uncharacterized protein n=1 Tax=Lepidopterella palustris CBS 459.81 TaxID=1314670 RepID=A0A8E2DZF5_9PEZI|nr:hypothetical protein K432DRAFT_447270 [Lepidopterella palustris CBS 459.81]